MSEMFQAQITSAKCNGVSPVSQWWELCASYLDTMPKTCANFPQIPSRSPNKMCQDHFLTSPYLGHNVLLYNITVLWHASHSIKYHNPLIIVQNVKLFSSYIFTNMYVNSPGRVLWDKQPAAVSLFCNKTKTNL